MATTRTEPQTAPPAPSRTAPERTWLWVMLMLAAAALFARFGHPMQIAWLRNLLIVFGSLLIEAMPFVALGAVVSATIEVFVPASSFAKLAALPRAVQIPAAALAGVAFPRCASAARCRSHGGSHGRVFRRPPRSRSCSPPRS